MSQASPIEIDWKELCRGAGPYPKAAYDFVREGLQYTVERAHPGGESLADESRHVSGQQLCLGLRDYAILKYGLLAPTVLAHWHVDRTDDFGRMVFAMVEAGLMSKTSQDTLDDFRAVFDFAEVFGAEPIRARLRTGDTLKRS